MGEDMVNFMEKHLCWHGTKPATADRKIHGHAATVNWNDPLYFYGSDAPLIRQSMNGTAGGWISESLKIHKMQVTWAVKNEMARTVEDVLARRTRALLLDAGESVRICPEVARIMADALGRDEAWIDKEVAEYTKLARQYILKSGKITLVAKPV
jgi:glycerol-3-phosphate dehydrogenase